jgi:hypothetical protein
VVIDFHAHIVPPRVKQHRLEYTQSDGGFAGIFSDPKARLATADDLIAAMDKDGIDVSVVLNYGWRTHNLCVEINSYIMESIARFPKRLVGFCTVTPEGGEAALKELERCVRGGVKGVGEIRPDMIPGDRLIDTFRPIAEFCVRNNLILLTHASEPVGHQYAGKGKATPDLIYALVTAFPDLQLVCAHWGGGLPFYALMPEVRDALKNVYFDTAASPFLYRPEIYRQASGLVGEGKILFGSDYPLIRQGRYLKEIGAQSLPAGTKERILWRNAAGLLGMTQGETYG